MVKKENPFETIITVLVVMFLVKFVLGGVTRAWIEKQMPKPGYTFPAAPGSTGAFKL